MKYGKLELGQIEAMVNKLGGMEGVKRFLSREVEIKIIEDEKKKLKEKEEERLRRWGVIR